MDRLRVLIGHCLFFTSHEKKSRNEVGSMGEKATKEMFGGSNAELHKRFKLSDGHVCVADVYDPDNKIIYESKVGRVPWSSHTKQQLEKYSMVLKEYPEEVKEVIYVCWKSTETKTYGLSKKCRDQFKERKNVKCIEFESVLKDFAECKCLAQTSTKFGIVQITQNVAKALILVTLRSADGRVKVIDKITGVRLPADKVGGFSATGPAADKNIPEAVRAKMSATTVYSNVLLAIGAVNMAVSVVSLGWSLVVRHRVCELQKLIPGLREEFAQLDAVLDRMDQILDEMLTVSVHHLQNVKCELKQMMDDMQSKYNTLKEKTTKLLNDARKSHGDSAISAAVSGITAGVGLITSVLSIITLNPLPLIVGSAGMITGAVGALLSLDNIDKANAIIHEINHDFSLISKHYNDATSKFNAVMSRL